MKLFVRSSFVLTAMTLLCGQIAAWADLYVVAVSAPAGHSEVFRLDERSGTVIARWTMGDETANGIAVSMLGDVYVAGNKMVAGEISRFSPTGDHLGGFSSQEYTLPSALVFGPEGNLYALSSLATDKGCYGQVLRFEPSGREVKTFIPAQTSTLGHFIDLAFRGEETLFVLDSERGVLRFDNQSGQFMGVFVPTGEDLVSPTGLAVGPDGNLYVSSREANTVLRFDGNTGKYMDTFISPGTQALDGPMGLAFGSDNNLYVTSSYDHRVVAFDGKTGDLRRVVASEEQGLHFPRRVTTGSVPFLMAVP